jgi:hypothetical protein
VVGTVARGVDKVDRMAKDNRMEGAKANKAVMAMVSNNNTKVNKVAIPDSLALSHFRR